MTMSATCRECGMPLNYDEFVTGATSADGLCSYCADPNKPELQAEAQEDLSWILDTVIDTYMGRHNVQTGIGAFLKAGRVLTTGKARALADLMTTVPTRSADSKFDAIVLYSGGKDSSYMLAKLSETDLKICAWMLNQGYQSPTAIANARNLCDQLEIPLVIEVPDRQGMDGLFRLGFGLKDGQDKDLLSRVMTYGSACWPCFAAIAARATAFCAENDVAFCFIGTQQGQNRLDLSGKPVLANRGLPPMEMMVERFMSPFRDFATSQGASGASILTGSKVRTVVTPYYEFVPKPSVPEQIEFLEGLGWTPPKNTGTCSTNCMINDLGRHIMRKRFGFDLYQVIDANERRMRRRTGPLEAPAALDCTSVHAAARMIQLDAEEQKEYGLDV